MINIDRIDSRPNHPKRSIGADASLSVSLFHLTHLLQAGVGLDDALVSVSELESGYRMRRIWDDVSSRVNGGQPLSDAFAAWPIVFSSTVVTLVRAGEANGQLANACQQAMELMQWQSALKSRMATVLAYPMFALLVLGGVTGFLFVSVVPSMESFLVSSQTPLAWHSRWLIALSAWLSIYLLPTSAIVMSVCLLVVLIARLSDNCQRFWHHLQLKLPLLGPILTALSLSRYANVSARLYTSGVQLDQSLALAEGVITNSALRNQLEQVRLSMVSGTSLSRSLTPAGLVPVAFKKILTAGESSGALDQALRRASIQQQQQADMSIRRAEALTGPTLLLIIGSMLLWMVISILGPVYQSAIDVVVLS